MSENGSLYFDEKSKRYFTNFDPTYLELGLVSAIGYFICIFSLSLYLRVTYVVLKYKSSHFVNSFYTLVLYLAIADCNFLFIQITVGYTIPLIGFKNVDQNVVAGFGFVALFLNLLIPQLIILIGINRYMAVCHAHKYQKIFGSKWTHVIVSGCTSIAFVVTSFFYFCTCFAFKVTHFWEISCSNRKCVDIVYYLGFFVWGTFSTSVPVVYCIFYVHYKWRKYKLAKTLNTEFEIDKADQKLLSQSLIISSVLVLFFVLFFAQSKVQNTFTDISLSFVACLNSSLNPYLYLYFNREIRRRIAFKCLINKTTHLNNVDKGRSRTNRVIPINVMNVQ